MRKTNSIKSMKIVVGGKGMIPRMNMIAPIKEPFEVDLNELNLILRTPSLTVKMVSPIDRHTVTINRKNYEGMLKLYTAWLAEKDHLDAEAEIENEKLQSEALPMTEEEKKDLAYAKSKGYVPANSHVITKSEAEEAVNSAFAAIIGEPKSIEPIKSQIKSVTDVLKEKK